jgi:hypothetical protein
MCFKRGTVRRRAGGDDRSLRADAVIGRYAKMRLPAGSAFSCTLCSIVNKHIESRKYINTRRQNLKFMYKICRNT